MNIPEKIRIAGVDFPVYQKEIVINDRDLCYGKISYDGSFIELSTGANTEHQRRCITLWHELTHAIIDNACFEVPEDKLENLCTIMARGIFQILQDNQTELFGKRLPNWTGTAEPITETEEITK